MEFRGTFRDGVVIPDQTDGLRNGDVVRFIPAKKRIKPSATASTRAKPSRTGKAVAKRRLDAFMSAFGCMKDRPDWKGKTTLEIVAELRKRTSKSVAGFGAWKHRTDIGDTAEYARTLRRRTSRGRRDA